eukprot:3609064-Amphidinium_carterae.1
MGQQIEGRHQLQHQRACQTATSTWATSDDSTQASTQLHQWDKRFHHPTPTQAPTKNTTRVDTTQHHNIQ